MIYSFATIVHLVAVVLTVIELALSAYCISEYVGGPRFFNGDGDGAFGGGHSPGPVNFILFDSIWTLLVLVYVGLAPLYYTHLFHRLASLALESLTMIFWFAGAIALAVFVGGPFDCGTSSLCGALEAAIAFAFVLWALFVFLCVVDAIEALRSRRHHNHKTASVTVPAI